MGNNSFGCLIGVLAIPFLGFVAILTFMAAKKVKAEKQEKEEKEKEIKRQQECKRNCITCSFKAEGYTICDTCIERSRILSEELRSDKSLNYEKIISKRKHYMQETINSFSKFYINDNFIHVISCDNILGEKYKNNSLDNSIEFFKDINGELDRKEIIKKYDLGSYSHEKVKEFKCLDGHVVKSKAEREIDNFFFSNGINHVYETKYVHPVTKKMAAPDFFIPEKNLYIEYFGLKDPDYLRNKEEKIEMYSSDHSINFEYFTGDDDNDIYEKLLRLCAKYSITTK